MARMRDKVSIKKPSFSARARLAWAVTRRRAGRKAKAAIAKTPTRTIGIQTSGPAIAAMTMRKIKTKGRSRKAPARGPEKNSLSDSNCRRRAIWEPMVAFSVATIGKCRIC